MRSFAVALMVLPALASAGPNDFARGRVINAEAPATAMRVTLPADLYDWVTRPDLGDVRVFNGAGEAIPYAIQRLNAPAEHTPWHSLPLFALPADAAEGGDATAVNIDLGEGGAIVAVRGGSKRGTGLPSYLLDATHHQAPISGLKLTWNQGPGFVAAFSLAASDDLNSWRTLVAEFTIAALEADGQRVEAREVTFENTSARYLKLTQLKGAIPVPITAAEARARHSEAPVRHWKTVRGEPAKDGYQFDLESHAPVDRVQVSLPGDSFIVRAGLASRPTPAAPWRSHGEHTFYRVAVNGAVARSPAAAVTASHRHWRAQPSQPIDRPLTLEAGWLPHQLVFVKRGAAPYVLAYGQAGTTGEPWPVASLIAQLGDGADVTALPAATLEPATVLGGPRRLQAAPEPIDWQTVILWAVLVIGVALVGGLAYRLLRS